MGERDQAENPKLTTAAASFFGLGRGSAIGLVGIMLALTAASTALFVHTVGVRLRRDVARLVLEDRWRSSTARAGAWPAPSGCCATRKPSRSRRTIGPTW